MSKTSNQKSHKGMRPESYACVRFFDATALKFIAVGIVNTILGAAIMFALYNVAGCSYWLSSSANYISVSILSFFLNKYFTFNNRQSSARQIVLFACNIAICYGIAYSLSGVIIRALFSFLEPSISDNIAMGFGLCLFTICNYLVQRFIIFKT